MGVKVLIVGAGPSGLSAAVELARCSIIPTIVDQKETPSTFPRAVGILPKTLRLLAPSGVTEQLLQQGITISQAHFHLQEKRKALLTMDAASDPLKRLLCLPQDQTEKILRENLEKRGGHVRYGATLTDLQEHAKGVEACIDGKTEYYDLIIGADGTHSRVRTCCNIPYPGTDLIDPWSICDIELHSNIPPALNLFFNPNNTICMMIPLSKTRIRLVSNTTDALKALPIDLDIQHTHHKRTFKIAIHQAQTYQTQHCYLVGDAAHTHSPVGGRGMNLGIEDAMYLAKCIRQNNLAQYGANRHRLGKKTIRQTERARRFVTQHHPILFSVLKLPLMDRLLIDKVLLAD